MEQDHRVLQASEELEPSEAQGVLDKRALRSRSIDLKGAGWKSISLVDVKGKVTFTVWLCGCNLRCPFCHNWKIANGSREACSEIDIEKMKGDLLSVLTLIDYFHVTGGEPLMQVNELKGLFKELKSEGVKISLNSNLTLPWLLEEVLPLLDHVATDLKLPEFYGYGEVASSAMFSNFLKSLDLLAEAHTKVELRIPIAKGYELSAYENLFRAVAPHLKFPHYFVLNKLLGPPLTEPRDEAWCRAHCFTGFDEGAEELDKLSKILNTANLR